MHVFTLLLAFPLFLLLFFVFTSRSARRRRITAAPDISNPRVQLLLVEKARFELRAILNKETHSVFHTLKAALEYHYGQRYLLLVEVPLGAFLGCPDPDTHKCINSKRVDFLVTNTKGYPLLVIEYQGTGHYQGTAFLRDQVKRAAFQQAQLPFYAMSHQTPAAAYQRAVVEAVARADGGAPDPRKI